jgi:diguanylate cyclase (GGDEF)-like protein
LRPAYVGLAMRSAAALYALGAVLLGVACALEEDAGVRVALGGLSALALAVALALVWLDRSGRDSLRLVFAADLLAVAIVGVVVAMTDGAHSAYSPYFLLAALHAAAFQPRARVLAAMALTTAAFLAPLAYDRDDASWFVGVAILALLPALAIVWITHLVVSALARERRALAIREAEAMRIAESDALTGIGNYRRFWGALESEAARSRRHDQPFSLIVLDLDGFKEINDGMGHAAGDLVLQAVAYLLTGRMRDTDLVARLGGDEFAALLPETPREGAEVLAIDIVQAVRELSVDVGDGQIASVTASVGVASSAELADERDEDGLLAAADFAMYEAKRSGRDSYAVHRG